MSTCRLIPSELAIGVFLVPITWLFGPIATFNVALTLAPFLSALAMFVLLRRWVSWMPAAFVGGLFYGFCPFVLVSLTQGWLMLGMAVVPPLVVVSLDELLFRQRRGPVVTGVLLGLLVALQFFLGTELLVIILFGGVIGVLLVAVYALVRHPESFRQHARYALVGLSAGVATAFVLLAYPAWFALAGPAHLSGPIWPGENLSYAGAVIKDFVIPAEPSRLLSALFRRGGGYQGPILSDQYFGFGVVAVLIGGIVAWRRDRRLWLFGAITVISVALSLGVERSQWLPWQLVSRLPLLENIIPSRFLVITYLAIAVMLGVIVDHTYVTVNGRINSPPAGSAVRPLAGRAVQYPRWIGAAAGFTVAAIALMPIATYLAADIPITSQPVVLPTWFRTVAPKLQGNQVLLVFPVPFAFEESSVTWQAVDRMPYSIAGGVGPGAVISHAGKEREGQIAIANASFPFTPDMHTLTTAGDVAAVRQALDGWGVTMVVIPDQTNLPEYEQTLSVTLAAALITAATGQRPIRQADAWVWIGVNHAPSPAIPTDIGYSKCTTRVRPHGTVAVEAATECVLDAAHGRSG